jgi:hypothetical protein
MLFWSMALEFGHFGKQIRNISKVLKCGAGEETCVAGNHSSIILTRK